MQKHPQSDRLSWGDTVFLHLEREGMPLNVASVCTFEGKIPYADYVRFVESRLPMIPRYLKRVVPAPYGLGLPSWEFDPEFDVRRHVQEITLRHGTDAVLKRVAAKLFGTVMDRRHPLWDLTLVHGLKGNRTGLIVRLHHCLADGIAGIGIVNVLLDASPHAPRVPRKKINFRVPPPRDAWTSLTSGAVDSYSDLVKRVLNGLGNVLSMAERVGATGRAIPTEEPSSLLPELTAFTERVKFNVLYRGPQKFAWTHISLDDVKAIRHTFGTSVNDVILALVTATVRRYQELHGERVKGKLLRLMVPVNLRGKDTPSEMGNCISLVPVTIPLDIRAPQKLLAAVHRRTEFLKHSHAAELVGLAGGMIGALPTPVQAAAGSLLGQIPFTPFNMVCTNVPGPQYPLYLLGHRMVRWYPYVPVGGEMAVNCAILSYDGTAYFGFSGDVHAAPDLARLETFLQESFVELRDAAGIKRPGKRSQRQKKAAARPKPAEPVAPLTPATVREPVRLNVPPFPVESAPTPEPKTEEGKVPHQLIA
jgi:diacylglycerol O-acyltransferase